MLKYVKILSFVSVILMGFVVGNGMAQYGNVTISSAVGISGETVDVVISAQASPISSVDLDLTFDTGIFEVADVQITGPFASWCDFAWQSTGTGINIATSGTCESLNLGLSGFNDVFTVTFNIVGQDTGAYEVTLPNVGGLANPVPFFDPNGSPLVVVGVQGGTISLLPIKLSIASGLAAQGSRGTVLDLNLDVFNPNGVAALQFDLLFDDNAITVTDITTNSRSAHMDIWQFSQIDGGVRLAVTGIGNKIDVGAGSIGEIILDVSSDASVDEYTMTFSRVVIADPVENRVEGKIVNGTLTVVSPAAILSLGKGAGNRGASGMIVPVSLYQTEAVASIQFDVQYDTDNLTMSGVTGYGLGDGCSFSLAGNTISGSCALDPGAGPVLEIAFDVNSGATEDSYTLAVANATVTGSEGALPTGVEDGQFDVVSAGTAVVTVAGAAAMIGATGNVAQVNLVNEVNVSAFQMDLQFDTQYMSVQDVSSTARSAGMDSLTWSALNGGIRVLFYSVGGGAIAPGDGSILEIDFDVVSGTPEGFYDLTLSGIVVGDENRDRLDFEAIDGALWIICGAMGDVNSNYSFDITDVVTLVNIMLNGIEYDDCTLQKGDYNEDGELNILDVVAMVDDILSGMTKSLSHNGTATVWADQVAVSEGQEFELPIYIETQAEILGAQLSLRYNPDVLKPGTPSLAKSSSHMNLASRAHDGELTIVVYSLNGRALPSGSGSVVTVPFRMTSGAMELGFSDVILAGYRGQPIAAEVRPVSLRTGTMPEEYGLSQNYPNPFNPETRIAFSLPSDSRVELSVYNVLGHRITTLVNTEMPAGQHEVTWVADSVPTGVYFYTITAGEFTATKKMILLK